MKAYQYLTMQFLLQEQAQMFVALKTDQGDTHQFMRQAVENTLDRAGKLLVEEGVAQGLPRDQAEVLFGGVNVDAFFLEYDNDRSGDFAPLRFVPANKTVVLGLVTSKSPELEPYDTIAARIDEAARYVPRDQLCLSPQCGFASTVEGNALTEDQQWAKLSMVVDYASRLWS